MPYNKSKTVNEENKNIDQTGFGQIDSSDKEEQTTLDEDKEEQTILDEDKEKHITLDAIKKDRDLKRKALGDDIFSLMSSPIKSSNIKLIPKKVQKEKEVASKPVSSKPSDSLGGIHKFKKK
jgi:hypothetical protein